VTSAQQKEIEKLNKTRSSLNNVFNDDKLLLVPTRHEGNSRNGKSLRPETRSGQDLADLSASTATIDLIKTSIAGEPIIEMTEDVIEVLKYD